MNLYQIASMFLHVVSGECLRAAMAGEPPRHNSLVTALEEELHKVARGAHLSAYQVLLGLAEGKDLKAAGPAEKELIEEARKTWTKLCSIQLKSKVTSIDETEE